MYLRSPKELKYIVVHHSVTPEDYNVRDIRQLHLSHPEIAYSDIGYHFLTKEDGLHVGRWIGYNGAHCRGEFYPYNQVSMNHCSIGLCMIGSFDKVKATDKHINETAYAIKRIAERYKIPLDRKHVIGHYMASSTFCPGEDTMKRLYAKLEI